jgi:retron-type reverse transcriptase
LNWQDKQGEGQSMQDKTIYGFLKYNQKDIWRYLQKDIDDDWFQDPIRYEDFKILSQDADFFEKNIRENFGRYQAQGHEIFHLPKGNFTLRYSLETSFYDRYMYLNLVLPLMKLFDPLIDNRVYNHRYCGEDGYLFLNPVNQWEKFEGIIRSEAHAQCVLETDIQNYFENINLATLKNDLEECLRDANVSTKELVQTRFIIDRLMECMEKWSYDGKRGLPQNRDCSSFLANIYMRSIDKIMIEAGFEYYRYMDDIRIICADRFKARQALKDLVINLRDKHLSLNGKKTRKILPGTELHDIILQPKIELKKIDSLLITKKKANVAIGYSLLKERCIELINGCKFEEREFRFCINRLSKLARCKEYKVPHDFWNEIAEGVVSAIVECPTSTDRVYDFLASVGLNIDSTAIIVDYLCNPEKSIYEWQNYWLWKLLIIREVKEDKLSDRARMILKNDVQIPDKAGAILYLAVFGNLDDKKKIMKSIDKNDSIFLQRHKWLASKGLDWIKDEVQIKKDEVHECLRGTYRVIGDRINTIVSLPPPTSFSDILRSLHQYD